MQNLTIQAEPSREGLVSSSDRKKEKKEKKARIEVDEEDVERKPSEQLRKKKSVGSVKRGRERQG
jgi:hypothetical protein